MISTITYRFNKSCYIKIISILFRSIYIKEQTLTEGSNTIWLEDIATPSGQIKVNNPGKLEKDKTYKLEFRSNGDYSDMSISRCDLYDGTKPKESLLEEKGIL